MVFMDQARINGTFQIGSVVHFEGYYSNGGSFVVTSIENERPATPSQSNGKDNSNNGHGDNGGDDNGGGEHGGGGGGD